MLFVGEIPSCAKFVMQFGESNFMISFLSVGIVQNLFHFLRKLFHFFPHKLWNISKDGTENSFLVFLSPKQLQNFNTQKRFLDVFHRSEKYGKTKKRDNGESGRGRRPEH